MNCFVRCEVMSKELEDGTGSTRVMSGPRVLEGHEHIDKQPVAE